METDRVLSRVGARILSEEEMQQITGGFVVSKSFFGSGLGTGACNFDPITCQIISGDCSDIPLVCLSQ